MRKPLHTMLKIELRDHIKLLERIEASDPYLSKEFDCPCPEGWDVSTHHCDDCLLHDCGRACECKCKTEALHSVASLHYDECEFGQILIYLANRIPRLQNLLLDIPKEELIA